MMGSELKEEEWHQYIELAEQDQRRKWKDGAESQENILVPKVRGGR